MSLLSKLAFWKKEKEEEFEYTRPSEIVFTEPKIDVPDVHIVVDNLEKNKPVILIMDDFPGMTRLLIDELERVQCCNVFDNFTVITAEGDYAAFAVEKFLDDPHMPKVDVAFLDITLGGVIRGIEYDGIDVGIMIKKSNPDSVIRFVTGHTLNKKNPEIFKFMEKFENHCGMPMDETYEAVSNYGPETIYKHVINKNGNRVFLLGSTLEEYFKKVKK